VLSDLHLEAVRYPEVVQLVRPDFAHERQQREMSHNQDYGMKC